MGILRTLGNEQSHLKAGFLGFNKSGKTYTAISLAIGVRDFFKLEAPIVFFDTEGGSDHHAQRVKDETGVDLIGHKGRSFDDLMTAAKEVEDGAGSVFLVDSITHPWRELMISYARKINKDPARLGLSDIMKIKDLWAPWTDWYLASPVHCIVCGRAGYEWNNVEDEETGETKLVKTGIKMKVEAEFGFEPSLLIDMERIQETEGMTIKRMWRRAVVIGDRYGDLDGKSMNDPDFEFFKPHIARLNPDAAHQPVDTGSHTNPDVGDINGWPKERRARTIAHEELKAELNARFPANTGKQAIAKDHILWGLFGTRSSTAVEGLRSEPLKAGLNAARKFLIDKDAMMDYLERAGNDEIKAFELCPELKPAEKVGIKIPELEQYGNKVLVGLVDAATAKVGDEALACIVRWLDSIGFSLASLNNKDHLAKVTAIDPGDIDWNHYRPTGDTVEVIPDSQIPF